MDKQILYTAILAAVKGGEKILSVYEDPNADFQIERKADNSPLTIADRLSHDIILKILSQTPYRTISEEGEQIAYEERQTWNQLWLVDPLDGTKEFLKRNGEFTVNIAFINNGLPDAGVIYIPVKHELYFGELEMGAYKMKGIEDISEMSDMDTLLAKAQRLPLKEKHERFTIVASRSHLNKETAEYIEKMQKLHNDVDIVSKGSSLKLCLIAEGVADVYPRFAPTMEWDTAAGHAIVRAAGKNVYQAEHLGCPLMYNKKNLLNPWFISE